MFDNLSKSKQILKHQETVSLRFISRCDFINFILNDTSLKSFLRNFELRCEI